VCVLASDIGLSKLLVHKFLRTISGKAANADPSYLQLTLAPFSPYLPQHEASSAHHAHFRPSSSENNGSAVCFAVLVHNLFFSKNTISMQHSIYMHNKIFFPTLNFYAHLNEKKNQLCIITRQVVLNSLIQKLN